jgi:hypothetical protein
MNKGWLKGLDTTLTERKNRLVSACLSLKKKKDGEVAYKFKSKSWTLRELFRIKILKINQVKGMKVENKI